MLDAPALIQQLEDMLEFDPTPQQVVETVKRYLAPKPKKPRIISPRDNAQFNEFWAAYPKRQGANPRAPAFKAWDAAIKAGADPIAIIVGIKTGAGYDKADVGTKFIPQAVTWLHERRWEDAPAPIAIDPQNQEHCSYVGCRTLSTGGPPPLIRGGQRLGNRQPKLRSTGEPFPVVVLR